MEPVKVLIVILLVAVLGLGGYLVYDKIQENKEREEAKYESKVLKDYLQKYSNEDHSNDTNKLILEATKDSEKTY